MRTYIEKGGFWAGEPEDLGYLSEAEREEIAQEGRVSVDPNDLGDVVE